MGKDKLDPEDNKRKILRRKKLLELLSKIESGELDSSKVPDGSVYRPQLTVRQEYSSPAERSSYNYGYEESRRSIWDLGYIKDKG